MANGFLKEMVSGHAPYAHIKGNHTAQVSLRIIKAIRKKDLPKKPLLDAPEKERLWRICMACWIFDPDVRFDEANTEVGFLRAGLRFDLTNVRIFF